MKCDGKENSGSGYMSIMDGDKVIIHNKGTYQQVDLYKRDKTLFVEFARGKYAKLSSNGVTSVPAIRWDEIITDAKIKETAFGLRIA